MGIPPLSEGVGEEVVFDKRHGLNLGGPKSAWQCLLGAPRFCGGTAELWRARRDGARTATPGTGPRPCRLTTGSKDFPARGQQASDGKSFLSGSGPSLPPIASSPRRFRLVPCRYKYSWNFAVPAGAAHRRRGHTCCRYRHYHPHRHLPRNRSTDAASTEGATRRGVAATNAPRAVANSHWPRRIRPTLLPPTPPLYCTTASAAIAAAAASAAVVTTAAAAARRAAAATNAAAGNAAAKAAAIRCRRLRHLDRRRRRQRLRPRCQRHPGGATPREWLASSKGP